MKRIAVLRVLGKKESIHKIIRRVEYETYSLIIARNRSRVIRKLVKKNQDGIVIISHDCKNEYVFEKWKKLYNELSIEIVLSIIEKICREAALKYNLKLPFEDIYLYAKPTVAYMFIEKLIGLSRMFTVITNENLNEEADKLYFKHGCLIRHIPKIETKEKDDILAICIEERGTPFSPIINITPEAISGDKVIDVRKIAVFDKEIKCISNELRGINGLVLHNLLGKTPAKNALIDINKSADSIFLLDTNAI